MAIQPLIAGTRVVADRVKINANFTELDTRLGVVEQAVDDLEAASGYVLPAGGIPESDLSASVQAKLNTDNGYIKPVGGIPESDLSTPLADKINAPKALPGANTDITSLGGITGGIAEVDYIRFDLTPETTPTTPGTMYWDAADNSKTISVVMDVAGTTLQVGQEQYYRVKASSAITDGQVVMFTGAQGNSGLMLGAPAAGIPNTHPDLVLGLATEDIANSATGYVTQFGLVRSINTTGSSQGETWLDGDTLYYNPSVVGGLTKVRPTAPNPVVIIGNVVSASNNGSIFVRVHRGSTFGYSDGNVQITSPQNNDFVVYDASQSRWENYSAANARTALGLGSAATTSVSAYATAAQGAKADTALQQAVQLTVSSTPVIVALGARGSLPFDVEIVPTDNTVTIRFEVSYNNQSSYTVIGDYTEYTPRRWVKAPTDTAPTHLRFSRIAGTATTSVVFLGL